MSGEAPDDDAASQSKCAWKCHHPECEPADDVGDVAALRAEIEQLRGWKAQALPVMSGLQELGRALGTPLGQQITARATVDLALDLRNQHDEARAEADRLRVTLGAVAEYREKLRTMPVQTPAAIGLTLDSILSAADPVSLADVREEDDAVACDAPAPFGRVTCTSPAGHDGMHTSGVQFWFGRTVCNDPESGDYSLVDHPVPTPECPGCGTPLECPDHGPSDAERRGEVDRLRATVSEIAEIVSTMPTDYPAHLLVAKHVRELRAVLSKADVSSEPHCSCGAHPHAEPDWIDHTDKCPWWIWKQAREIAEQRNRIRPQPPTNTTTQEF